MFNVNIAYVFLICLMLTLHMYFCLMLIVYVKMHFYLYSCICICIFLQMLNVNCICENVFVYLFYFRWIQKFLYLVENFVVLIIFGLNKICLKLELCVITSDIWHICIFVYFLVKSSRNRKHTSPCEALWSMDAWKKLRKICHWCYAFEHISNIHRDARWFGISLKRGFDQQTYSSGILNHC